MKKTEVRWGVKVTVKDIELRCPECRQPFTNAKDFYFDPTDPTRLICQRPVRRKGIAQACQGTLQSPTFALMYDKAHRSGTLTKVNELKKVLCIHEVT